MNVSGFNPGGPDHESRGLAGTPHERSPLRAGRGADPGRAGEAVFDQVRSVIGAIRFGEVRVIIQDGVIVQIDRIEKLRLR